VVEHPNGQRVRLDADGVVQVAEPGRAWLDTGWRVIADSALGPDDRCGAAGLVLVVLGRRVADGL